MHRRIKIDARTVAVQANHSSQKFASFEFAVGMAMSVAFDGEFFRVPRAALAHNAVNIDASAAAEQSDVSETNSGTIAAANHRHIAGPHPRKHAGAVHAQGNAPVLCQSLGDVARIFFAPFAADPPNTLPRL